MHHRQSVDGHIYRAEATFALPTATKACLNGGALATSSSLSAGYSPLSSTGLVLLVNGVAGENMTGCIRRVSYWPRVLSDAEMQQVTT